MRHHFNFSTEGAFKSLWKDLKYHIMLARGQCQVVSGDPRCFQVADIIIFGGYRDQGGGQRPFDDDARIMMHWWLCTSQTNRAKCFGDTTPLIEGGMKRNIFIIFTEDTLTIQKPKTNNLTTNILTPRIRDSSSCSSVKNRANTLSNSWIAC